MNALRRVIFGSGIFLLLGTLGGLHARAQNLVANGDFSAGTNGWQFTYAAMFGQAYCDTSLHNGTAEIAGNAPYAFLTQSIPTIPGAFYLVSFQYAMYSSGQIFPVYATLGGVPLAFNYSTNRSVVSPQFIVQTTQTNSLLKFNFLTDLDWGQQIGYVSVTLVTNLVMNGDFSSGSNDWAFWYDNRYGVAFVNSFDGGFAFVEGNAPEATLTQDIPTVPGAYYRVSFDYEMISEHGPAFTEPAGFAGSYLSPDHSNTNLTLLTTNEFIAQATDTNSLLEFYFQTDLDWGQGIGNVCVQPVIQPQCNLLSSSPSQLSLGLTGTPGVPYIFQSASSLASPVNWQSFATNFADTNGSCTYTVTNPVAPAFYRTVLK